MTYQIDNHNIDVAARHGRLHPLAHRDGDCRAAGTCIFDGCAIC
jgi:hypothetical protein